MLVERRARIWAFSHSERIKGKHEAAKPLERWPLLAFGDLTWHLPALR